MKKYYWITREGDKVCVDDLSTEHMRNILKMLIRNRLEQEEMLGLTHDDQHNG